jgi:hypothetical protein
MVWFPHKCLGAGCAEWAIESTVRFSCQFVNTLGIRERLKRPLHNKSNPADRSLKLLFRCIFRIVMPNSDNCLLLKASMWMQQE